MNRLKVGDLVQVIAGKDKGKQGKVAQAPRSRTTRVVVEGVNMVTRHTRPNAKQPAGRQGHEGSADPRLEGDADRSRRRASPRA